MNPVAATAPPMTFQEHLQELRMRLIWSLLAVAAAFACTYGLRFRLWTWVQRPFLEAMAVQTRQPAAGLQPWAFTDLTEPFFSLMRLSIWAAAFLAAPFLFYQLWAFIRPGLYARERRMVVPFVLATSAMFLLGAAFAYYEAFRFLGNILFQESSLAGLRANLHIDSYLDLFLYTLLTTGIMFELPVLVYFLTRFRIITAAWMLKYWRHATVVIMTASAFLTPGDVVVTTVFFGLILEGLYLLSVAVAWAARPKPLD
jgi:sec-independent protein translocase protein TatC